jgi:hypothetical protein
MHMESPAHPVPARIRTSAARDRSVQGDIRWSHRCGELDEVNTGQQIWYNELVLRMLSGEETHFWKCSDCPQLGIRLSSH